MKLKHKMTKPIFSCLLAMTAPVAGLAGSGEADPQIEALVPGSIKVHSTEEVLIFLQGHNFEWPVASDSPTLIVPRIVTNDLPRNREQGLDVASRKSMQITDSAVLVSAPAITLEFGASETFTVTARMNAVSEVTVHVV